MINKNIKYYLGVFILLITTTLAFASFWGEDNCRTVTEQRTAGSCVSIYKVCDNYVFWINTGTTREFVGVDCSNQLPNPNF